MFKKIANSVKLEMVQYCYKWTDLFIKKLKNGFKRTYCQKMQFSRLPRYQTVAEFSKHTGF